MIQPKMTSRRFKDNQKGIHMGRVPSIREQSRTLWFTATYIDGEEKGYDLCIRKDYYELNGVVESKVVSIEWFGVEIYPDRAMLRDIETSIKEAEAEALASQDSFSFTFSVANEDLCVLSELAAGMLSGFSATPQDVLRKRVFAQIRAQIPHV